MGSGCGNNPNNFLKKTSDKLIKYTGDPVPQLGICTGDLLSEIEHTLIQKILDYATGVGIALPDIDLTTCALFTQQLTCCTTCTDLPCLMQAYLTGLCTLYGDVETLKTEVGDLLNGPYDIACLSNLGSNPKLTAIIQELILEFCALVQLVTNLQTQVNNLTTGLPTTIGDFLRAHISSCQSQLSITGTGSSTQLVFKGFTPIGGVIAYAGPTAGLFDSTGLGLTNTEMCGWAMSNGNNGTIDMRENVPVGAGAGVMGGSGSGPSNIGTPSNYALYALVGEPTHTLNTSQLPTVGVTVSGSHTHDITAYSDCKSTTSISNNIWVVDVATPGSGTCPVDSTTAPYNIPHTFSGKISTETITLSGTIAGGNLAHENRQPSRALIFIQRIS